MEIFIADPEISVIANVTKAASIVSPRSIEIDGIRFSLLNSKPWTLVVLVGHRTENILHRIVQSNTQLKATRRSILLRIADSDAGAICLIVRRGDTAKAKQISKWMKSGKDCNQQEGLLSRKQNNWRAHIPRAKS